MQTLLRHLAVVGFVSAFALVSGCTPPPQRQVVYSGSTSRCEQCGVVSDIRQIETQKGSSPLGMVIGAVAGGLLGNQVGKGNGRTAATVVGAVAGGAVGNEVGKRNGQPDQAFKISVRLDDGRYATVTQADDPQIRQGDYVEIRNNRVYRR